MPLINKNYVLSLFVIIFLSSCISSRYNLENNIGLYEVIETECKVTEGLFNPCHDIRFIEIVKGQFHGIEPDQLALVQWYAAGDDPELKYEAIDIRNHKRMLQDENLLWLTNTHIDNENEKEFFILESGRLTDYIFQQQRKNKAGEVFIRNFHYKLSPTSRSEIIEFQLNYPVDK